MATSELTPPPLSPEHATLLAEIGSLVEILRERLLHQEGEKFVALVDRVRTLSEPAAASGGPESQELQKLLSGLDLDTATRMVRAFRLGFQLGNIAEQSHRTIDLDAGRGAHENWIADALAGIGDESIRQDSIRAAERLEVRPVFTAQIGRAS